MVSNDKLEAPRLYTQREKALKACEQIEAAGTPLSKATVAEAAGVSLGTARRTLLTFLDRKNVEPKLEPLSPESRHRQYKEALLQAKKQMREQIAREVRLEIEVEFDAYVKRWTEKVQWAEKVASAYRGFISRADFRKIKACLHPDHNSFTYAAEALQIFSELEDVLVKPDISSYNDIQLPKTAAEMMARRYDKSIR